MHENGDGRVSSEFAATLEEVPTKQLVDYLDYISEIGDRDRVHGIRLAFATRVDRERYNDRFEMTLAKFALTQFGELAERLGNIRRSADEADARVADLLSGHRSTECADRGRRVGYPSPGVLPHLTQS
jgi:hypothetical protein